MNTGEQKDRMRWILFLVFVAAFCALVVGTIAMVFGGVGEPTGKERDLLTKVFIGEVGAVVLALAYSLFGLRRYQETTPAKPPQSSFVAKTYPRSQHPAFFTEVETLTPVAKKITLIATGLNLIWEKHIADLLIQRASSKEAEVTICLGNPWNPHVENRLIEEEMRGARPPIGKQGIERSIRDLVQRHKAAGSPPGLRICLFNHYPTFATLIFDRDIFIYPYAYQVLGNTSPVFHVIDNDSKEALFFLRNAERIVSDAVPAADLVAIMEDHKHYSEKWLGVAVYVVPKPASEFYQYGSSVLGYDVWKEKELPLGDSELADLREYTGDALEYGFHATLVDALYCVSESDVDRIRAELRTLSEDFAPFVLSCFRIDSTFRGGSDVVVRCEDASGTVEALHHELLSRVNRLAISSRYITGHTKKGVPSQDRARSSLMIRRYLSPFILSRLEPHFTLCTNMPRDEDTRAKVVQKLEAGLANLGELSVEVDGICLMVRRHEEAHWRVLESYALSGR